MKKLYLALVFFAISGFLAFGDEGEQEEIDYLLFLPDSSTEFIDQEHAMIQLDNAAKYLKMRDLISGQIFVYGYAASFANDIDPAELSRNRALYVINELSRRDISKNMFADPVAFGSVDIWGSNTDEEGRSPNRRVRILLDGTVLTPATIQAVDPVAQTPVIVQEQPLPVKAAPNTSRSKFPWWILLPVLLGLAALLFLALKRRKKSDEEVPKETVIASPPAPAPQPVKTIVEKTEKAPEREIKQVPKIKPEPAPVPEPQPKPQPEPIPEIEQKPEPAAVPAAPIKKIKVIEEEEIRLYAYGLFEKRFGQNGDEAGDWYRSIYELTGYYEAQGYRVLLYWEKE